MSLFALFACSGLSGGFETSDIDSVRVEPSELRLETTPGAAPEATFTATLVLTDGTEVALSDVAWASSNSSAGLVDDDGLFVAADTNGGVTEVSATYLGVEGASTVTVVYTEDLVVGELDPAVIEAFDQATPQAGGPELEYPADGIRVPRNLEGLGFAWAEQATLDVSRLRLRSEITDISIFTTETEWTSTAELWKRIAAGNSRGSVEASVQTATWDGASLGAVSEGEAAELEINRFDARGSVLYWSTSDQAIRRIAFGETTSAHFWSGHDGNACVGCHVVNNETDRMVVTHDGMNGVFEVVDIGDPDNPQRTVPADDQKRLTFKSITPDGLYILGANDGELSLYRVSDGGYVRDYPELPYRLSMPDISPDGTEVALIYYEDDRPDTEFTDGSLVVADLDPETMDITNLRTLVETDDGMNVYYPAFSPDGAWISYNRAPGRSYGHQEAELWLVNREGTIDLRLDRANQGPSLQNSWSRWGPLPDDDVLWLTFSSKRSYALSDAIGDAQPPQIWVTGIDEALAEQGVDPSSPAFWLPGQNTTSDNHLPAWWNK